MMQQYLQIKERHRDAILFFRLGDFYEMFFEDAQTASKVLDIALTSRNKNEESSVPLCGVPYHSAEPYIRKLLEAGHKVAVCEQLEDPQSAKGVLQRQVVRIITPGTITAAEALDPRGNNYLVAVCQGRSGLGLAISDITTGEFRFTRLANEWSLFDELGRIRPSELLSAETDRILRERLRKEFPSLHVTVLDGNCFSDAARERLSASAIAGAEFWEEGLRAASAIVSYLNRNAADSLNVLRQLEAYQASHYLVLDDATRTNLELLATYQGGCKGSLLAVLDRTVTPMGARLLQDWLLAPLADGVPSDGRAAAEPSLASQLGFRQRKIVANDATRDALLDVFAGAMPKPALLFTASHGMVWPNGDPRQEAGGRLLDREDLEELRHAALPPKNGCLRVKQGAGGLSRSPAPRGRGKAVAAGGPPAYDPAGFGPGAEGGMSLWEAVVLGTVQGLTEFLPVSSSAHLVLVPWALGWADPGLTFDVAVHLGTLGSLFLYFRADLVGLGRRLLEQGQEVPRQAHAPSRIRKPEVPPM